MEEIYVNVEYEKAVHSKSSTDHTGPKISENIFYRAIVLCLGLLSVFLLIGLIILVVHYHYSIRSAAAELSTIKANMTESFQDSEKELSILTAEKDQLKSKLSSVTKEKDQLNARLSSLRTVKEQLNSNLSSLTAEKDQLKSKLSSVTREKDQLNDRLSSLTREKDELNATLIEITKERDRLESVTRKHCPAEWTIFSSSCYFLSSQSDSWTNARRDCQNKGADLVLIESLKEQEFLSGFTSESAWIGLSDRDEEGTWKWIDGTTMTFGYWDVEEPNNSVANSNDGEDCAEIKVQKGHKWNDKPCNLFVRWICEKKV
ncbi:hypothetical protein Q5P01_013923 [Channa striata]|uniref:C-type lectin domain-containing protein n=1 Tax=Channa striata TaxID=64152 RepID=A0AA88MKY9_CHASR|nr:hypothetical protein Q5P01_013923 [Channa striata]